MALALDLQTPALAASVEQTTDNRPVFASTARIARQRRDAWQHQLPSASADVRLGMTSYTFNVRSARRPRTIGRYFTYLRRNRLRVGMPTRYFYIFAAVS